jgi:hypothetical protein
MDKLKELFAWLRKQPVIGPLLNILNSRKGFIATWLTLLILRAIPDLEKVHGELDVVVGALVTIVVIWLTTSLGYAYEDAAEKSAPKVVPAVVPVAPVVPVDGTVTTTSTTITSTDTQPSNNEPVD